MKHTLPLRWVVRGLVAMLAGAAPLRNALAQENTNSTWRTGVSVGWLDLEGDEAVDDSPVVSVRLGRDVSESWTVEGVLDLVPQLDERFRVEWSNGERISRLQEQSDSSATDTSGARLSVDAVRHFDRGARLDPYLGVGCGVVWYEEDFGRQSEPAARARAGCELNLTPNLAIQADLCGMAVGVETELNSIGSVGLVWKFGGPRAAKQPAPPPDDADHDGLKDQAERDVHHTDPANADSDYDGLTDSQEVLKSHTDPLRRDTDGGGVADGHEVIEDLTDPLQGPDDLQFFELQMNFDPGSSVVRAEYLSDLDAVGKLLQSDPGATARIEGHVDRKNLSEERTEKRLTRERAGMVEKYFEKNLKIAGGRITAVGYGFDRPKAANDPVLGNPQNNRIEIYIRKAKPQAE